LLEILKIVAFETK